ncbi:hypothetical protein FO488_05430 [Geobacter sp. FeAm09]|uniref:aldehyde ferredoxin oxidoreductase N-terminal domain-containing protein n=1 Tax=Geobacter sp. FeAm09 TaxID=2597769 RepID=UPI0011F04EBF|nr:aldehyde ferredoxin oxidoreductase N-terminal domain-containing protein [Geobacter sp. FeAm09]QEM67647.1 hypothetical protein FO488_05430 [Geobacter sp. FeAm09]
MAEYGGWTGKTLRVNLTTGSISTEDTLAKYKDVIGGVGLGNKVLWNEVPAGTTAFSPENRLVFAQGPLSGSGGPLTGRCSIISLLPYAMNDLPGAGHMGGHFGPEIKYAGYDAIIIHGKATTPVWLRIENDKVSLEDATAMWGNGIYYAYEQVALKMGSDAHVAAIGQIGENQFRLSNILCDKSHSAGGGLGAVMGSKNLKAIGIKGTGSVKIATDKKSWKALNNYILSLLGSNNNHVVPSTQQPWAEYYDSGSRWTSAPGIFWGAAQPPVETGYCTDFESTTSDCPSPKNKLGRRCHKGYKDYGTVGANHTVKMNGCHHCPIRCHISTDFPELEQYGAFRYNENTCTGYRAMSDLMTRTLSSDANNALRCDNMSTYVSHDIGFWTDYGAYTSTYTWAKTHVMTAAECTYLGLPASYVGKTPFQNRLPAAELTILSGNSTGAKPYTAGTPWAKSDAGDPTAIQDLAALFIAKNNKVPTFTNVVCNGTYRWGEQWPEIDFISEHGKSLTHFKFGMEKHHGVESMGQVGCLINLFYNRDPMNHSHQNQTVGPPAALRETIMKELFSSSTSVSIFNDPAGSDVGIVNSANTSGYSAATKGKAAFAAACLVDVELKNSLIECDWTFPLWMSPLKSRSYRGDATVSAQSYTAVTGEAMTWPQLQKIGLRIFTLFRCLTARYMDYYVKQADATKAVNMRTDHDVMAPWHFETANSPVNVATGNTDCYPASNVAFTGTTQLMTEADMNVARDYIYDMFGWDKTTGMPTSATLTSLGLDYIKDDAAVAKLIVA